MPIVNQSFTVALANGTLGNRVLRRLAGTNMCSLGVRLAVLAERTSRNVELPPSDRTGCGLMEAADELTG